MEKEINYRLFALCFRCEHRANFMETGLRPRNECGEITLGVSSCYMYHPVRPIIIGKRSKDKRPVTLGLFSARVERQQIYPRMILRYKKLKSGIVAYWEPKENKNEKEGKG